jgi:hypothetical protein
MSRRASATRCCMPPERWRGYVCSKPLRPTRSSSSYAWRSVPLSNLLPSVGGSSAFWSAVRHGSSVGRWNISATSCLGSVTSRPLTEMLPSLSGMRPAMRRSSVDLPQPLGPTIETNSPGVASKLTWSTARTPPSNCLTASVTEIVPRAPPGASAPCCRSARTTPSYTGVPVQRPANVCAAIVCDPTALLSDSSRRAPLKVD